MQGLAWVGRRHHHQLHNQALVLSLYYGVEGGVCLCFTKFSGFHSDGDISLDTWYFSSSLTVAN